MTENAAHARLSAMGRSIKWHGGIAAVLGTAALLLAALTWLPGTLPFAEARLPLFSVAVVAPFVVAAGVRSVLAGVSKDSAWLAFRCLPSKVQGSLAARWPLLERRN
jgi:hypothetical protein